MTVSHYLSRVKKKFTNAYLLVFTFIDSLTLTKLDIHIFTISKSSKLKFLKKVRQAIIEFFRLEKK